jgi:hypothetical protein
MITLHKAFFLVNRNETKQVSLETLAEKARLIFATVGYSSLGL